LGFWVFGRLFLKKPKKRLGMREANEPSTKTEASTLARRHTDTRRERVKESKRGERGNTDREDLTDLITLCCVA